MSMEDRLREALQQEAEHLHPPYGSPDTAIRRGRRRRASSLIGGAALVLTIVGGTAAGFQLAGTSDQPDQNTTAAEQTDTTDRPAALESGIVDIVWDRVALPIPDGTDVWNYQVRATETGFVAVATGFRNSDERPAEPAELLLVWESANGSDWSLISEASPFEGSVDSILNTGEGFVAVVRTFDNGLDTYPPARLYSSTDGLNWRQGATTLDVEAGTYLWFSAAAAGNGSTVVAGAIQTEVPQPPAVFEEAGVALQQGIGGEFTVTDLATGAVITTVPGEDVFGGDAAIYGPDGEVIVTLPQDALVPDGPDGSMSELTIEQDGVRVVITFDEDPRFVATDIATGTDLARGPIDELYQPSRVTITDPETGAVILDISTDELFAALDEGWATSGSDYRSTSEMILLVSADGVTWDRANLALDAAEEISVDGLSFGPDGFVLSVGSYGAERFTQQAWRSDDGRSWDLLSTAGDSYSPLTADDEAYYRLAYDNQATVARSLNGVDWTPVYRPTQPGTYFSRLAFGGLGVVAIGQVSTDNFGPPVVIAKDGRTLVVDGQAGRITVTDDATGEVLTEIELDVYAVDPPAQIVTDDTGKTITITDENGEPVMTFTEDEANRASEDAQGDYQYEIPYTAIAFSPDGEEWFTGTTAGLDVVYPDIVAVGENAIVVVGQSAEFYGELESGSETVTTITTDGSYNGSSNGGGTYVWVGRLG